MLTSNILCTLAKSDTSHDFGPAMVEVSSSSIPNASNSACTYYTNEDVLLDSIVGLKRSNDKNAGDDYSKPFTLKDIGGEHIAETYTTYLYEPFENLDARFKEITPDGNIFFVVDTPGGLLDELKRLSRSDRREGPTYYWVQNRQTLYDPAGKSDPITLSGKELFTGNKHVKFAWENTQAKSFSRSEHFPSWNNKTNAGAKGIDKSKLSTLNKLFYCSNDIFQILDADVSNNFKSQETKCIMKMPNNEIVVMNKEMAKISGGSFTKGEYSKLKNELSSMITQLVQGKPIDAKFTNQHHLPAKRLGDQGQALSCLKPSMELQYFPEISTGLTEKSTRPDVKNITSNGNHCFATIDRPALCAAILYNVPIILYSYYGGERFALFINKALLKPEVIFENSKREYERFYKLMQDKVSEFATKIPSYLRYIEDIKASIGAIIDKNIYKTITNKLPGASYTYKDRNGSEKTIVYKFNFTTEEEHFRRLIINMFKYIKHLEFIHSMRDINIIDDMSAYVSPAEIHALQLGMTGGAVEKRKRNVLNNTAQKLQQKRAKLDPAVEKVAANLAHIRNDYNAFSSTVALMDTLEDYAIKVPAIDDLNKSNISASGLFAAVSGTSRTFVPKYEEWTLRKYIKEIIGALKRVFPDLIPGFVDLLKNILQLVELHSVDKNKADKIAYLGEIAELKGVLSGGSRRRGGSSSVEVETDAILRSTFAILFSAVTINSYTNNKFTIKFASGSPFNNTVLQKIYDSLNSEPYVPIIGTMGERSINDVQLENTPVVIDAPYYIDFIEEYIYKDARLTDMYNRLINKQDIIVHRGIENIIRDIIGTNGINRAPIIPLPANSSRRTLKRKFANISTIRSNSSNNNGLIQLPPSKIRKMNVTAKAPKYVYSYVGGRKYNKIRQRSLQRTRRRHKKAVKRYNKTRKNIR